MSNLVVNLHPTMRATGKRPIGPRVWRRKDRQMIKRLLASLVAVQHRDTRADAAAAKVSGEAFLFVQRRDGPIDNAIKRLKTTCVEALAEREW